MRVAGRLEVFGQLGRQFPVGQESVSLLPDPHPGAQMAFVDGHRFLAPIPAGPVGDPVPVTPFVALDVVDPAGRLGPHLGIQGIGVAFLDQAAVLQFDLELVVLAGLQAGNEDLPDAGTAHRPHHVPPSVPLVEIADDADPPGIGGPDGETDASDGQVEIPDHVQVGSQLLVDLVVVPLGKEVGVEFAEGGQEGIGVEELGGGTVAVFRPQPVRERVGPLRDDAFEKPGGVPLDHGEPLSRPDIDNLGTDRVGQECPHGDPPGSPFQFDLVHAEDLERIVVLGPDDGLDGAAIDRTAHALPPGWMSDGPMIAQRAPRKAPAVHSGRLHRGPAIRVREGGF